jgi:hypothetical protein
MSFGRILEENNTNNTETPSKSLCDHPFAVHCPGGECAMTYHSCAVKISCPSGLTTCSDGSCAGKISDCGITKCPSGYVKCWDQKCALDKSKCSTRPICPWNSPVLCSDGSC